MTFKELAVKLKSSVQTVPNLINVLSDAFEDMESSSGGGGVNYSTTEQDTGLKWIDNKSIYQKTLVLNNQNIAAAGTEIDITALGADMCNYVEAGSFYTIVDGSSTLKRSFLRIEYTEPNSIYIYSTVNRTGTTCYITLQYTKVSD